MSTCLNQGAVLTCTLNLCFKSKLRKMMYTPNKPQFYYEKVGFNGRVYMMLTSIRVAYTANQRPVVQSIVSLTTSLRCQLVKYMPNKLSNTLLFFVGKM